jgi:hypothetical protein
MLKTSYMAKQTLTLIESYKSHVNVIEKEGLMNGRIMKALSSMSQYKDKLKYCRNLLKTKDEVMEVYKSKNKKKRLPYDINFCLKNIDIIEREGIQTKSPAPKLKKNNQKTKDKENWKVKSSVRAISTPMYD